MVDKTLVKNSELANIPFSACARLTTTCIIMHVSAYSVTHCRSGGRLCCVSHTPRGSRYLGMLYLSDHWEAFWRPQFFTNISTKFICSSRSSATTNYTYIKTKRKKITYLALSHCHTRLQAAFTWTWSVQFSSVMLFWKKRGRQIFIFNHYQIILQLAILIMIMPLP